MWQAYLGYAACMVLYMNPNVFRIKIPAERVMTDPIVVIRTMPAERSASQSMAFAITKLLMAVGEANRINRTPRSTPLKPRKYAANKSTRGITTIFISEAVSVSPNIFLEDLKSKEQPMPSNANGIAIEDMYPMILSSMAGSGI